MPVTPINELSLMSESAALMMPRTAALSVSLTLYVVCPSRDLTVSTGPSTASTVPRTRTGGGCWAKLTDVASSRAKPAAPSARRAIWFMGSSRNLVADGTPVDSEQPCANRSYSLSHGAIFHDNKARGGAQCPQRPRA